MTSLTVAAKEDESISNLREKSKAETKSAEWSDAENVALVEATSSFPAGTPDRWAKVAEKVNSVGSNNRTPLACIHHAQNQHHKVFKHQKPLQATTPAPSTAPSADKSKPSPAPKANQPGVPAMKLPEKSDWTIEQQLQLEEGLKKYPAKSFRNVADRWDKVARGITGKDKKQVKLRMAALDALNK